MYNCLFRIHFCDENKNLITLKHRYIFLSYRNFHDMFQFGSRPISFLLKRKHVLVYRHNNPEVCLANCTVLEIRNINTVCVLHFCVNFSLTSLYLTK